MDARQTRTGWRAASADTTSTGGCTSGPTAASLRKRPWPSSGKSAPAAPARSARPCSSGRAAPCGGTRSRRRLRESRPTVLRWLPAAATALAVGFLALTVLRPSKHAALEPPRVPVELKLAGAKARTVAVAGDFNGWAAAAMKNGEDGVWRIQLSLPPGRYQYAFVVDEQKWVPDPQAATLVDSGYGGADSVLDIPL